MLLAYTSKLWIRRQSDDVIQKWLVQATVAMH